MEKIEYFSFEYRLSKEDYLNWFLFSANHSKTTINARRKNKIIVSVIYFSLLIFLFINYKDPYLFFLNLFIFLVLLVIYFSLEKRKYIKHYKNFVDEKLTSRIGIPFWAEFKDDKLFGKEGNSESSIAFKDFSEINETENYIFVKIFETNCIILPKNIAEIQKIKSNLKFISKEYNIPYQEELNWKFK